jgi:hypothetical protein
MAIKIVLGKTPKSFKPFIVSFDTPEGEKAAVEVTYKYRTRAQFGEMLNAMFKDAGQEDAQKEAGADAVDFEVLFQKMGDKNADHLLSSIEAWGLDFEVTRANLVQLANEIPASAAAFMAAYRNACIEGKLGN